ncbi:MAG: extracellular solute-binding protein [Pseudomonadales bacterium]|jgi:putrescine transport system substrate-binding protein
MDLKRVCRWLAVGTLAISLAPLTHADGRLNVYNWAAYIADDTVEKFEKETGIHVTYDVYDNNEILEGKLLAGNTGYDVVVPSVDFLARQIQAGIYQPLDKKKLTNYDQLDPELLAKVAPLDPGNTYAVPYMWGSTGIGYDRSKVVERLGKDAPLDSWALLFDPKNLARLTDCGVAFLDSPVDVFSSVLIYLGKDPNPTNPADYQGEALSLLRSLKPYITYFHSSKYIDDLAAGEICVALGFSGDVAQARASAEEADNGVDITYVIPREGALMYFDMLAIPKDARNVNEAHRFIDYLMRPDIAAANTNYIWYPNPVPASAPLVDDAIRNDPSIYPPESVRQKLWVSKVRPPKVDRVLNRAWTEVKTGT